MKITDEMVAEFELRHAQYQSVKVALELVAPLIVKAYTKDLLDHAWDGRSRGAILGAVEQLEEAQQAPPLGYRPAHGAEDRADG